MFLEFTVGNFLSFKEKKTFSLEAGSITEHKDNVVKEGKYKVLRSAVIYGANSSGKSNFIKALDFMVQTIKNSSKLNSTDKLNTKRFLLSTETENQPSFFEIVFLENNTRFRYGFELDNNIIHSEWLYSLNENSKKEVLYFIRNVDGIGVADIFDDAKGLESKTRDNGLFLSLGDQFNIDTSKAVMKNISKLYVRSGIEHSNSVFATNMMFDNDRDKELLNFFIRKLDLG
ncbi:MAG: AAA family ATPase, partial [Flavobacterium sp.]